jgi:ribosomal-protein-alanine N-acetyltransferase
LIRTPTSADAPALAALEAQIFPETAWSEASLRAQLADGDSWVALVGPPDSPLAYVIIRVAADEAELLRVGVLPRARRRGLAGALLSAGAAWAAQRGARRLFLEVDAADPVALAFYGAAGFGSTGRRRDYYGPGRDALLLERPL